MCDAAPTTRSTSRLPSSPACWACRPTTTSCSVASSTTCWRTSAPTKRPVTRCPRASTPTSTTTSRTTPPTRGRPHQLPARRRDRGIEAGARARPRHGRAVADRRHRHRGAPSAPRSGIWRPIRPTGVASPRSRSSRRGRRGAAPGLRPGDDGPDRGPGRRAPGRQLKAGDWVLLPFPAANRDPEMFDDADRVILDRAVNRHGLRLGHPPMPGLEPGSHGAQGGGAGVDGPVPGLRAGRPWRPSPGPQARSRAACRCASSIVPDEIPPGRSWRRPRRGARHRRGSGSRRPRSRRCGWWPSPARTPRAWLSARRATTGRSPNAGRCAGSAAGRPPAARRGPPPPPGPRRPATAVDEADGQGLLAVHAPSGEDEVHGSAVADEPGSRTVPRR